MSRFMLPVVSTLLLLAVAAAARAQQDLTAAKDLYTAAKYEEALAVLDRAKEEKPPSADAALTLEQYRAMCLLALNRKADAEKAIEAVADLDPFYQPAEDDAAPWVRAAFREARQKVLPSALQRLYGHAKDAYNRKDMTEAVTAFERVLKILDDPDLTLDKAAKGDMKMVAQGFVDLAQAASARPVQPVVQMPAPTAEPPAAENTPGPPTPSAPASPDKPAGAASSADTSIFDSSSPNVTPPLPIRRDVPRWAYGPRPAPGTTVVVEIVVRENGSIDSVVVRQSAGRYYDETVTQAARNWLYRPAVKAGQPVRYRLLVKVVISGPPEPDGASR